jgi:hypothetical protein
VDEARRLRRSSKMFKSSKKPQIPPLYHNGGW